jgi:endo-1,4-beta-xylanase
VRGHVLVYARDDGYTLPQWIRDQQDKITPDKARQLLSDYIHAVVGRYKGKVLAWDVLNEAIDDAPNARPFQLRNSFWFRKLGRDFVKLAFQFAHEADPQAELYLNEYGAEGLGRKSDAVLEMVRWVRSEGVFVSGVGMQWHKGANTRLASGDDFYQNAARLGKEGFNFQVTELDVAVPVKPYPAQDARYGQEPASPNDLKQQADVYRAVLRYALSLPNCRGLQLWGFSDKHSWIPGFSGGKDGAALISDAKFQPKPAHQSLLEELAAAHPEP